MRRQFVRRARRLPSYQWKRAVHGSMVALLGSGVGTLVAANVALAVSETEPNDIFPGQAATVGTTFNGLLVDQVDLDLYHYTGLTPGDLFNFAFDTFVFDQATFQFARYTDQTTLVDPVQLVDPTHAGSIPGVVPAGGQLTFGASLLSTSTFEGYNVVLTTTSAVPVPATAALLAAGLAGVAFARRRPRL
jgi:hypothetical protein